MTILALFVDAIGIVALAFILLWCGARLFNRIGVHQLVGGAKVKVVFH